MDLILKGAIAGFTLSFLIGPVFFALIETGMEKGFRAGLAMCAGIWLSDFLIIIITFLGLSYVLALVEWDGFRPWLGSIGGIILIAFGLASWFKPPSTEGLKDKFQLNKLNYLNLSIKGFVINSLNPFTVIFWLGIMSTVVANSAKTGAQASMFFTSLLFVVIIFDLLKVLLAKKISQYLRIEYIGTLKKFIGLTLLVFGFVLIWRVWTF